jgi:biopolymer transport protein ExbB
MKKTIFIFAIFGLLNLTNNNLVAQDVNDTSATMEMTSDSMSVDSITSDSAALAEKIVLEAIDEVEEKDASFHQVLKEKFIEGGAGFMGVVLIALILGLALCIERIIYLNLATTNTEKLLADIDESLKSGGVESAKEVCRNTPGPVASIFYQGLERSSEGLEMVEKSIVSYGSVQMGRLERNTSWISLFIALAPMLGFMGTVIGMIGAFDAIEANNNISPALVAGGIKVALLTTVFGLIVAMILQVFYNYIISKIDSLVNTMEDASITLIDILASQESSKK